MTSKIKVNILADGGDNAIITSDGAGSFTASSSLASSVQSVGGLQNTPAFKAYLSSTQSSISHDTWVKLNINAESYDTNNAYDTSTYKFTPAVVGKYYLNATAYIYNSSNIPRRAGIKIYKNGSPITEEWNRIVDTSSLLYEWSISVSTTDNCTSTSDYYEVYIYTNNAAGANNGNVSGGERVTFFTGYKLIGA